ncbi:substrate-binding periplasmic protein [Halopseudomonas pelagia]|uniref:substrate-binding periplasmic protein n=1 Tax=Halopseudomonas pelagia TaxID=553151 RepID=UPI00039A5C95|nr:ABC transporter substrate-binding protein [Halopseudomonas pelagia]
MDSTLNSSHDALVDKAGGTLLSEHLNWLQKITLLIALTLTCHSAFAAEPIKLVTGEEYPPFTGSDLHSGGVLTALVTNAFAHSSVTTQVEFRPWVRGYEDSLKLEYAATFPYIATDERKANFLFSDPLYLLKIRFYVTPNSPFQQGSAQELAQAVFCLPAGYEFAGWAADQREKLNFVRPRTIEQCYEMMSRNRVDVLISNPANVAYLATLAQHKRQPLILRELQHPLADVTLHLMIPAHHPQAETLMNDFNRGLRQMHSSGDSARLFNNHPEYQLVLASPPSDAKR